MDTSSSWGANVGRETSWRYLSLLQVVDLIALHTDLEEMLPALSAALAKVVEFDALGFILPRESGNATDFYGIRPCKSESPRCRVNHQVLPPIHETSLGALWATHAPIILHDLDADNKFPELSASLRIRGDRSACIVPLATALRPVGILGFVSSRSGAYDDEDVAFLQRVASQVAVALDNVRHHELAAKYRRQVEADRDHWRTLLEVNNAVVGTLDLTSLLAAITPNLRRMVPHDFTSLALLEAETGHLGLYAMDPKLPAALSEAVTSIKPEDSPFSTAIMTRQPLVLTPDQLTHLPPAMMKVLEVTGVERLCFIPLITPRRVLGGLTMARRSDTPFSAGEIERAFKAAGQMAIAIENALAFREIAALKDRLALENLYLEDEIRGHYEFEEIIGDSPALQRVLAQVRSVADTDTTVLLLGETGTGKELLARALHKHSPRAERPLVTVNCATSPAGLLESEWFGHEKGAFTGALNQKVGRFELAHRGTLFLDEIGDVPLDLQAKLLRVLQEHEIERLGSTRTIKVDFRLVAATNRDLPEMVGTRDFRSDLYYRLNVFPIRIPPLRERREDIPPLVQYFTQRYARRLRRTIEAVPRETMDALCRWPWPGNVRELQNVIERAVILSKGSLLHVPLSDFQSSDAPAAVVSETLEATEREHILKVLEDTRWVIGGPKGAAVRLGLKRTTLASTMKRLGISRPGPHGN